MKPVTSNKATVKNEGQSDDENIRYKINLAYFNSTTKSPKIIKKQEKLPNDDVDIRYKFPTVLLTRTIDRKPKPKPKIKVNFWSTKQLANKVHETENMKGKSNRRHTIAVPSKDSVSLKPKNSMVKVRKRVSFLPSPLFSENHVPMVTVPDDLTIQLNEEEANDLGEDLNQAFVNNDARKQKVTDVPKRKAMSSMTQIGPKDMKRKRSDEDLTHRLHGTENELEYFSKYVVQKLRRMETNQRIYSENLINTVLMLGQLGKLNGKSKIGDA